MGFLLQVMLAKQEAEGLKGKVEGERARLRAEAQSAQQAELYRLRQQLAEAEMVGIKQ